MSNEWWHGSREPLKEIRPFLHVGTIEQARMRGGRGCHLTRISLSTARTVRRRDTGSWRERDLLGIRGAGLVIYLNRFEGIPLEEFEAARLECRRVDEVGDARFRRLHPSARDSVIVIDPCLARICA